MWKIPWPTAVLIPLISLGQAYSPAHAEEVYRLIQNQNGFDLPSVSLPQGQDEVRAADGTSCSSSISGGGAYMDVGVITSNRSVYNNDMSAYGRVVVPLGRKPKRLDCSKLYELEVQRLKMEIELLRMGLGGGEIASGAPVRARQVSDRRDWVSDGWSTEGERR